MTVLLPYKIAYDSFKLYLQYLGKKQTNSKVPVPIKTGGGVHLVLNNLGTSKGSFKKFV